MLPSISASSACGGSRETLGVNWQSHAAMGSSVSDGRALKCRATQSMDGPVDGHRERRRGGHAAAFHDTYLQFIAFRLEGETQAGGRRLMRRFARAEEHD